MKARKTSGSSLELSRARERTVTAYLRRLSPSLYSQYIVTSSYERTSEEHSVVVLAGQRRGRFCLSRATQPASWRSGLIPSTHRRDHDGLELCGWPFADVSAFFGRGSLASGGRPHRYRRRKRKNGMGNRLGSPKGNARSHRSRSSGKAIISRPRESSASATPLATHRGSLTAGRCAICQ